MKHYDGPSYSNFVEESKAKYKKPSHWRKINHVRQTITEGRKWKTLYCV